MARLVVLTEGYTGRTYELKTERTTVGRVEDNAFQIPDPSVSSHHCEVLLQGEKVVIRDLDSTNGSYIDGEPITEAELKPGQVVRLGQVDVRLETAAPAASSGKKVIDKTQIIPQGVKMDQLAAAGQTVVINKTAFVKKSKKGRNIMIAVGIILGLVIIGFLVTVLMTAKSGGE